jgi:hypothetical protein
MAGPAQLMLIFASFGYRAPRNAMVVTSSGDDQSILATTASRLMPRLR